MRKHNFLPDYLKTPACPMKVSVSVNAALIELSAIPCCHEARLIWVSADDDVANEAMIVENIPDLGVVRFTGVTGWHSVSFKTTTDLSRALVHGYGFWERQVLEAKHRATARRNATPPHAHMDPLRATLQAIVDEIGGQYGHDDEPGTLNRVARLARNALTAR